MVAVAKRLRPNNPAVDQSQMVGKPAKVFPFYYRIFHRHMAAVPESVLGIQKGIPDSHIFYVLERVFPFHLQVGDYDVPAFKQKIFRFYLRIGNFDVPAFPTELRRDNPAVKNPNMIALPQAFDAVNIAIFDPAILRIPDRRSGFIVHRRVQQLEPMGVPKGIPQREDTIFYSYVAAFLQDGFSVGRAGEQAGGNETVCQMVQSPFLIKLLVFDVIAHAFPSFLEEMMPPLFISYKMNF